MNTPRLSQKNEAMHFPVDFWIRNFLGRGKTDAAIPLVAVLFLGLYNNTAHIFQIGTDWAVFDEHSSIFFHIQIDVNYVLDVLIQSSVSSAMNSVEIYDLYDGVRQKVNRQKLKSFSNNIMGFGTDKFASYSLNSNC